MKRLAAGSALLGDHDFLCRQLAKLARSHRQWCRPGRDVSYEMEHDGKCGLEGFAPRQGSFHTHRLGTADLFVIWQERRRTSWLV